MEVQFSAVSAYDDNHHIINIKTDENETIRVGQVISLMRMDETFVECTISAMRKWEINPNEKNGKCADVDSISNGESCEIDVYGDIGDIWNTSMPPLEKIKQRAHMVNLMPYKEINGGDESIYDNIDEKFSVPEKVILYLQTTQPHMMAMGIYQHPFKDMTLLGPYWYTDGEYYWDRDAWKYVMKYHVKLPTAFINKVMSDKGTIFLEKCAESDESWSKRIKAFKESKNGLCLIPDNSGDIPFEKF